MFVDTLYYVVGTHSGTLIGVFSLGYFHWGTVVGVLPLGYSRPFRYICLYYCCVVKCVLTNYVIQPENKALCRIKKLPVTFFWWTCAC